MEKTYVEIFRKRTQDQKVVCFWGFTLHISLPFIPASPVAQLHRFLTNTIEKFAVRGLNFQREARKTDRYRQMMRQVVPEESL